MKRFAVQLLPIAFFTLSSVAQEKSEATSSDLEQINLVFKKYSEAIQKGKGYEALKYISQKTIDYYDTLIYHALYSDEKELQKINILSRVAILRMRHSESLAFWDTMTAKKLLPQMWETSPPAGEIPQVTLADCKVDNLKAACVLQLEGEPTEMQSFFNKEDGQWKIDINSINSTGIEEMKKDIKRRGITETEYILLAIQEENPSVRKEDLYKPLKKH